MAEMMLTVNAALFIYYHCSNLLAATFDFTTFTHRPFKVVPFFTAWLFCSDINYHLFFLKVFQHNVCMHRTPLV